MRGISTWKRVGKIALTVVVVMLVGAVLLGVCNAIFADGAWTFGWSDYRYDDTLYEVGGGTVPASTVTRIELDWVDGIMVISPCDDQFLSLSEQTDATLAESGKMRWRVSEDGTTLSIKYRASSWFLGDGNNKNLNLRIPRELLSQLVSLDVHTDASDVLLKELSIPTVKVNTVTGDVKALSCVSENLDLSTKSGKMDWDGAVTQELRLVSESGEMQFASPTCPLRAELSSKNADLTLALPVEANFTLSYAGDIASDLPVTKGEGAYVFGDGSAAFRAEITGDGGTLFFKKYQAK